MGGLLIGSELHWGAVRGSLDAEDENRPFGKPPWTAGSSWLLVPAMQGPCRKDAARVPSTIRFLLAVYSQKTLTFTFAPFSF